MPVFRRDPRDMVGQNPTGRPTRSSAGKRRQAARAMDRDLEGTEWAPEEDQEGQEESTS